MRLIAAPDDVVNQLDRAIWLTPPFDAVYSAPTEGSISVGLVSAFSAISASGPSGSGISVAGVSVIDTSIGIQRVKVL